MKRLIALIASLFIGSAAAAQGDEAETRKARSIAQLQAEGVPVLETLPMIETEAASVRRSQDEVVERAIALMIVAVKGETRDHDLSQSLFTQFRAKRFFTPQEQAFLDDPTPSDYDATQFVWRYEGAAVMLWALGVIDTLPRPDRIADVPGMAATLRELGTDGLRARASLRPQSQILDAADLMYRYDWAIVNARINDAAPPAGLDPVVVYERHYALNWLIGYADQPWDEVSTDT